MSVKLGVSAGIQARAGASASASAGVGVSASIGFGTQASSDESVFNAFNFKVEIETEDSSGSQTLCNAAFAECDGLEMSMDVKTIKQGGDNARVIHLPGRFSYGQLTLKRGMTTNFDLWDWMAQVRSPEGMGKKATITVILLSSSSEGGLLDAGEKSPLVSFQLDGCIPIKMRAPSLNAKDGQIAIEEMQIAYEKLARLTS